MGGRAVKNQGKNLKIERRRSALGAVQSRRFAVSPVTRAIRSVLTVSAAALAFAKEGAAVVVAAEVEAVAWGTARRRSSRRPTC